MVSSLIFQMQCHSVVELQNIYSMALQTKIFKTLVFLHETDRGCLIDDINFCSMHLDKLGEFVTCEAQ